MSSLLQNTLASGRLFAYMENAGNSKSLNLNVILATLLSISYPPHCSKLYPLALGRPNDLQSIIRNSPLIGSIWMLVHEPWLIKEKLFDEKFTFPKTLSISLLVTMPDYVISWLGGREAASILGNMVDETKSIFASFGHGLQRTPGVNLPKRPQKPTDDADGIK